MGTHRTGWRGAAVLVTGASRGIGAEVARLASEHGARVGLIARSSGDLEKVASGLPGLAAVAVADVGEREQVDSAVRSLESALGPTDILVNNAGMGAYRPFAGSHAREAEHLIRVNYFGAVYAIGAVLPGMLARGKGHIVTVASISGRVAVPLEATYVASKFAVVGLSEALSVELAPSGIGVSIVNPGPVATDFFAARGHSYTRRFPRQVSAERVAAAVIKTVERGREETTVPRWLRVALVMRVLFPALSSAGTRRSFRRDLAAWNRS